jgi:uncharacterized protein YktB (UPF0637 family)
MNAHLMQPIKSQAVLFVYFAMYYESNRETAVAQWLRYCATNQRVAGSIPDGVNGIFHWHKSFWSQYGSGGRLSL